MCVCVLIKYGPPLSSRFVLEEQLPLAAASPFSATRRVLCVGLKPVKYSTHAQLLFVRCMYAVRLIVAPKKTIRSTFHDNCAHPLANFSLAVTFAVRWTEIYQNWRSFKNHGSPREEKESFSDRRDIERV